jgi:hypothetical protein
MSESLFAPNVVYLHDAETLAALPPAEQFQLTASPTHWMCNALIRLVNQMEGSERNEPPRPIHWDIFSPEATQEFTQNPEASLLARLNVVSNLSTLLALELPRNFQELLWRVDLFDDPGLAAAAFEPNPDQPFFSTDNRTVKLAMIQSYRRIAFALADHEGIDRHLLLAAPDDEFGTPDPFDHLPLPGIELVRYVGSHAAKDGSHLPDHLKKLLPLARELERTLRETAQKSGPYESDAYLHFVLGPDLVGKQAELAALNPDSAAWFAEQAPRLFTAAEQLATFFPPELADAVHDSFLQKTVASVYGYVQHERHGRHMREVVILGEDYQLPCELDGDEPFTLVDELLEVIDQEYRLSQDPSTKVIRSVLRSPDAGFQNYRLVNGDKISSAYLRPWGSPSFDPNLEYGRNGEGVEASIGRIMKLAPGFLPLGKAAAKLADTISIRIDREGIDPYEVRDALNPQRDPTRAIGSLALDIGSVLGPESNLGVRIGRFLAVCDKLRAQKISPEPSSLNHASQYFAPSTDSDFAAMAGRLARSYDALS